jgi:hypothetical protein
VKNLAALARWIEMKKCRRRGVASAKGESNESHQQWRNGCEEKRGENSGEAERQ